MRRYLFVPFEEKDEVKKLGGMYDPQVKQWFIPENMEEANFSKWITREHFDYVQSSKVNHAPRTTFIDDIEAAGAMLNGKSIIGDGKFHHIEVLGDKGGKLSGSYRYFDDGVPHGYFKNFRTGEEIKKSYPREEIYQNRLSPQELAKLREEQQRKIEQHKKEQEEQEKIVAQNISKLLENMPTTLNNPSEYFKKKGISGTNFTFQALDKNGNNLTWIPLRDKDGNVTTLQTIASDGSKRFFSGGKKHGSFHVVNGVINPQDKIIICEGFATGASIYVSLQENHVRNISVVAAMDAGNILPVAQELKEMYKNNQFIIACDNDHLSALKIGVNTGVTYGEKAAQTINAQIAIPYFEANEAGSDFNDLMLAHGKEAVFNTFKGLLNAKEKNFNNSNNKIKFNSNEIIYIIIPKDNIELRQEAKEHGARYQPYKKSWYIPRGRDPSYFLNNPEKFPLNEVLNNLEKEKNEKLSNRASVIGEISKEFQKKTKDSLVNENNEIAKEIQDMAKNIKFSKGDQEQNDEALKQGINYCFYHLGR